MTTERSNANKTLQTIKHEPKHYKTNQMTKQNKTTQHEPTKMNPQKSERTTN